VGLLLAGGASGGAEQIRDRDRALEPIQAEELITVAQAAAILGTDRTRVHILMREGRLRAFKEATKGRTLRYRYRLAEA
jgi:hypothetical protein